MLERSAKTSLASRLRRTEEKLRRIQASRSWRWTSLLRRLWPSFRPAEPAPEPETVPPTVLADTCSQHGEATVLFTLLPENAPHILVDVGAHDGNYLSNSLPFIRSGWQALLIEPNPEQFPKLAELHSGNPRAKCLQMACAEKPGQYRFFHSDDKFQSMSTLSRELAAGLNIDVSRSIMVKADTLTNLLRQNGLPRDFSLLLIDTESYDLEVLRGLDFDQFQPRLILTEDIDNYDLPKNQAKYRLLESKGYILEMKIKENSIWRRGAAD